MAGRPTQKHLTSLAAAGGVVAGTFGVAWSAGLLHLSAHPAGSAVAISSVFVSVVAAAVAIVKIRTEAVVAIVKIRTERAANRMYADNAVEIIKRIKDPERAFGLQIAAQIAARDELTPEIMKFLREITKPDTCCRLMSEEMPASVPVNGPSDGPPPVPSTSSRTLPDMPSSRDDGRYLQQSQGDPPYANGESSPGVIE